MPQDEIAGWDGLQWVSRRWVAPVAVLTAAALVAVAIWVNRSPDPDQTTAWHPGQSSSSPSPTTTSSPEPSLTPSVTATSSSPAAGAGQPASAPKPQIKDFSTAYNGLIVTVSFTLVAQPDRGPFTCVVRRAMNDGTEEFPCNVGPVSRTYQYPFCCGSEVYITATDRHGVRSDQFNDVIMIPRPDPPTYSNLRAWLDEGSVHVAFDVSFAPGDYPSCDIYISQFTAGLQFRQLDMPCEGGVAVSFPGTGGTYRVSIGISSPSHLNPPRFPEVQVSIG